MMKIVLAFVLTFFLAVSQIPHHDPVAHAPLVYKVNLEDPPIKRWGPIIKDFHEPLSRFMQYFDLLPISKTFFKDVEWYAKN